jgi:hypothetical protein
MNAPQSIGEIASLTVARWAWWRKAITDPSQIGKSIPIHEGDPQVGYYRTKNRSGAFEPVAIFYPEGSETMVAYRNGKEVDPVAIWVWCCKYPIEYADYLKAMDGKGWADDDATVAEQTAQIGDNSGDVDETELLKDQIEAALKGTETYKVITDDATATRALSLRNRLNELSGKADKLREVLKKPHLEAGKAVDAKFQPLVKQAKAGADAVRDAIATFETEKLRKRREGELRRAEAESKRDIAATPEPQPEANPVTHTVKPSYGKAATVSAKLVVSEVTDWFALARFMVGHPEMDDLLMKLAQRAVDAGKTVPGVTVVEKAVVR